MLAFIIPISLITSGRINNPPANRRNSNSMVIKWRSSQLDDMNFSLPPHRRFHARNCHRQFYSRACTSETCRCASRLYVIILLSRNICRETTGVFERSRGATTVTYRVPRKSCAFSKSRESKLKRARRIFSSPGYL